MFFVNYFSRGLAACRAGILAALILPLLAISPYGSSSLAASLKRLETVDFPYYGVCGRAGFYFLDGSTMEIHYDEGIERFNAPGGIIEASCSANGSVIFFSTSDGTYSVKRNDPKKIVTVATVPIRILPSPHSDKIAIGSLFAEPDDIYETKCGEGLSGDAPAYVIDLRCHGDDYADFAWLFNDMLIAYHPDSVFLFKDNNIERALLTIQIAPLENLASSAEWPIIFTIGGMRRCNRDLVCTKGDHDVALVLSDNNSGDVFIYRNDKTFMGREEIFLEQNEKPLAVIGGKLLSRLNGREFISKIEGGRQ